jgi:hypothetical protein
MVKEDRNMANLETTLNNALDAGKGVLRLFPTWVPRTFCSCILMIRTPSVHTGEGSMSAGLPPR